MRWQGGRFVERYEQEVVTAAERAKEATCLRGAECFVPIPG